LWMGEHDWGKWRVVMAEAQAPEDTERGVCMRI
jgi:hypothetical protein